MDIPFSLGIVIGISGALSQALSYVFSRRFVGHDGQTAHDLLVISHIIMAVMCAVLAPFLWVTPVDGWGPVILLLLSTAGCYLAAQGILFWTLKHITASRVSPLLGAKLVFIAIGSWVIYDMRLTPWAWLAVVLAAIAVMSLNNIGGRIAPKAFIGVLFVCLGYTGSDLSIVTLLKKLSHTPSVRETCFAVMLTYWVCGIYGILSVKVLKRSTAQAWRQAIPFSLTWLIGMFCLFTSIAVVELVLASVLQSTRGILSLIIAPLIAYLGHEHIEHKVETKTRIRQILAALLMTAAIGLYVWGK